MSAHWISQGSRGKPCSMKFISHHEVDPESGCWNWMRGVNKFGYGILGGHWGKMTGRSILAHRIAWEDRNEIAIPDRWTIDHLCKNRKCVNPDHLEPVPHRINIQRGSRTKLRDYDVQSIIRHAAEGQSATAIAKSHGITTSQVHKIVCGAAWPNIGSSYRNRATLLHDRKKPRNNICDVLIPYGPGEAL